MGNITVARSNQLKAIVILMMLCLLLFNRDPQGLFEPLFYIGSQPLSYYISLFCDACIPIFALISGYGLFFKYKKEPGKSYVKQNYKRLVKLYINYWIILVIFAVVLGWILQKEDYSGRFVTFLLNFTAISPTYNGAWWFFTIYVFFVLTARFWFRLLDRYNTFAVLIVLAFIYLVAFYFRIYKPSQNHNFFRWLHTEGSLYFCTLYQFILGASTFKEGWDKQLSNFFSGLSYKSFVALFLTLFLVVFHGIVTNFVVAPFTGLFFILFFIQVKLPKFIGAFLDFMAPHATNLRLIHMFFYLIYFPVLCLLCLVRNIERPILKRLKI